jgi:hypothetical protein
MSPLDLLRRALPAAAMPGPPADAPAGSVRARRGSGLSAAASGAVAALLTLVPVVILASLVWVTTADARLGWVDAVLAGMSFWLLGHGVPVLLSTGVLGLVPLGALVGVLLIGTWSAGRATWGPAEHGHRSALRAAGGWAAGYAMVIAVVGVLALAGPADPHIARWLAATVGLPAVMALTGMVRSLDHDDVDELLEQLWVPAALRRGWRPALHTTAVLLGAGTLAAVAAAGLAAGDVWALQRELRPGLVGGGVLALLQVLALPNIGLWVVSFVAGPGFSVVEGAAVTWDGSSSALMPMIPVLAAHPEAAVFPAATPVVAAVIVALGGWLGWQSLAATARLASLRAKALTILSAAVSTGVLVGLLDWVGGGALGMDRLAAVGAPAGLMALTVTGWLLLGACLVLVWDWRSLRR